MCVSWSIWLKVLRGRKRMIDRTCALKLWNLKFFFTRVTQCWRFEINIRDRVLCAVHTCTAKRTLIHTTLAACIARADPRYEGARALVNTWGLSLSLVYTCVCLYWRSDQRILVPRERERYCLYVRAECVYLYSSRLLLLILYLFVFVNNLHWINIFVGSCDDLIWF